MAKYLIDFNKALKNLDGADIEGNTIGRTLGLALVTQPKGDALKLYSWALDMNRGNKIELDQSDFETLKTFVKETEILNVILKAQALEIMNDSKIDQ